MQRKKALRAQRLGKVHPAGNSEEGGAQNSIYGKKSEPSRQRRPFTLVSAEETERLRKRGAKLKKETQRVFAEEKKKGEEKER